MYIEMYEIILIIRRNFFQIINLDSGIDYRDHGGSESSTFFIKSECDAEHEINLIFKVSFIYVKAVLYINY